MEVKRPYRIVKHRYSGIWQLWDWTRPAEVRIYPVDSFTAAWILVDHIRFWWRYGVEPSEWKWTCHADGIWRRVPRLAVPE